MKNPTKHAGLILVTIMACVCATVLAVTRSVAARASQNEWLFTKQATAVSCAKNLSGYAGSSGDKNNEGGCSHMGVSCTLFNNTNKRNKTHAC